MDELISALSSFLDKPPEKRYGEIMQIVNYPENSQAMGALGLIFPLCTTEEAIVLSDKFGQSQLSSPDFVFPRPLLKVFFFDAEREADPEKLSALCSRLFSHPEAEIRKTMLSFVSDGTIKMEGTVYLEALLLLADQEPEIRQKAADALSSLTTENMVPERFFTVFYMENLRYGKSLAEDISSHEDAAAFIYLCLSISPFGTIRAKDQDIPKELIASLYSSLDKSRVDFTEALSDAMELFCSRREGFSGLSRKDAKTLRRATRNFVSSSVQISGGKLPRKLPSPRKNPALPRQKAKAR
ncbi:hypothetical protein GF412_03880 [Candidatus Micrarchaeota archaeon]|nr:hypothetical protein [Candidatus Micrarchaeota archaeon]MBD3418089.1 hypothetical protein [Candidatus Micrarchaeota archaeon]